MELMQASNQWASRPADERFTSLTALNNHCTAQRRSSKQLVKSSRAFHAAPIEDDNNGMVLVSNETGLLVLPSHWSFGQIAARANIVPAGALRKLPAPIAADCINYGLKVRDVEETGLLLRKEERGLVSLGAMTGPNYGRIWNNEVTQALVNRFGDGISGDFRVPGEFGQQVEVTKANTTLYTSDRDMFVFLADETHRIEVPNRRDGKSGEMARGFFVWNSEVGDSTFGIATFLFDYVCCNRIVWGAAEFKEIRLRHTSGAPDRFIEQVQPAIQRYANSSTHSITTAIEAAKQHRIGDQDEVNEFLAKRFSKSEVKAINLAMFVDEQRPIETLWDATTAVTAYARSVNFQNERVMLEREGGKIMALAA